MIPLFPLDLRKILLNRVTSKAAPKTPLELWTNRTPSIRHLHVWGCQGEIRAYNPQERKLMQEQSVNISLVIQKIQRDICFIVLIIV